MMSACANPILYGFLNENFKKEFHLMFQKVQKMFQMKDTSNSHEDV